MVKTKDNLITVRLKLHELHHLEALISQQAIRPTKAAAAHHFMLKGMGYEPPPHESHADAEQPAKATSKGKKAK